MRVVVLFLISVSVVAALPATWQRKQEQRIIGGSVTTIEEYPFGASLLSSLLGVFFSQTCGGSIINNRSVLTAAHCFMLVPFSGGWRIRVGSSNAHSGGTVHRTGRIIRHPNFNRFTIDNDIAIMRVNTQFTFSPSIAAGSIPGPNYNLGDDQPVWAIGWGTTRYQGPTSEQLRHVQLWSVNQDLCITRYQELRRTVTDNMLCSGWLDVGGRDQCQGDSGGPLLHNNVIVGVCSWGHECAHPRYPGVNARVNRFTDWIVNNA